MDQSTVRRWYDPDKVTSHILAMMQEISSACDLKGRPESSDRYAERQLAWVNVRSVLFIVAVFGVMAAVFFIPDLLPGQWLAKDGNSQVVVKWIMIGVPIGLGVRAKARLKRATERAELHDSCIQELASQFEDLRDARRFPLQRNDSPCIPQLTTGCKANQHCSLSGSYRNKALVMLEVEYLAANVLTAPQALDRSQSKLAGDPDTEQFSRMRTAQAIIFLSPLTNVPDLFIAGKCESLCSYQSRWVKDVGGRPRSSKVPTGIDSQFEAFSSCPETSQNLFTESLRELLTLRPDAVVQLIGGYVVVVPRTWSSATPLNTSVSAFEIQLDLDFACSIYESFANCPSRSTTAMA